MVAELASIRAGIATIIASFSDCPHPGLERSVQNTTDGVYRTRG